MSIIIYQKKTVSPTRGGINRMSIIYNNILSKNGYEVWYLASETDNNDLQKKQLSLKGKTQGERKNEFLKIIHQYEVQLMIYQDGISPYNNYILRWAKEYGIKIIDVIHNTLRGMYGIGGFPFLSSIKPHLVHTIVNKCVNCYFMYKYRKLYREEFELSDRVVLLSDKFREEISYFTGWHDFSKFSAISNPLTLWPQHDFQIKKQKIVLHVGLLSSQKRQDLLLKIWKFVEERESDWQLIIIGDGTWRKKLETQCKKFGLKQVKFLGFQSPEEYYNDASIFCLTSAYESFGLVLVESMAFGCVPMAFNSFETACDIIDNDVNGKLIKPFDIQAYADELMKLMNDEIRRERMGIAAVKKSKTFDVDIIGKQWIDLVKTLL